MRRISMLLLLAGLSLLIPACQNDVSPTGPLPDGISTSSNVKILQLGTPENVPGLPLGATLHGANGMALTSGGELYVASLFNREINSLTIDGGSVACCFDAGDGVDGADDLLLGPDGSLYWSNYWTGDVVKKAPGGATTSVYVGPGVGPLALAPDGRLFVARHFLGTGLYMIEPDFSGPAQKYQDLGNIGGLAVTDSGYIFASLWNEGRIVMMNGDAAQATVTTFARRFSVPAGLALDAAGDLLVADHWTGQVWKIPVVGNDRDGPDVHEDEPLGPKAITPEGRELIAELEPGLAYLEPHPSGHLFVSNSQDGSVIKLTNWGGKRTIAPAGMIMPGGIAIRETATGDEHLLIADAWSLRIYNRTTGEDCGVHRCMIDVNGFTAPMTASMGPDELVVSSWFGQVQILDPETCSVTDTYDFHPASEVPLNAISYNGGHVVAGMVTGSVFYAGSKAPLANGLILPSGLATDGSRLWVADRATGTVWHIATDGVALAEPVAVAVGLQAPEGLAVLNERYLLAVETGADRLSRIDTMRGLFTVVAEGLEVGVEAPPGQPMTWQFNGVTVYDETTAYVTSDIANLVYQITLPSINSHGEFEEDGGGEDI